MCLFGNIKIFVDYISYLIFFWDKTQRTLQQYTKELSLSLHSYEFKLNAISVHLKRQSGKRMFIL